MATLIMAYAFDFEPEQEDEDWQDDTSEIPSLPKAMVPLADLLNADGDKNNVSNTETCESPY
jgi:SET domain-containing protein 6